MNGAPTTEHWMRFAAHALDQLPDSIRERKIVLTCLLASLPSGHESKPEIKGLLYQLRSHEMALERLQAELPLAFKKGGK